MWSGRSIACWPVAALAAVLLTSSPARAAAAGVPRAGPVARITGYIDEARRVELRGQVHRALPRSTDLGAADGTLPTERIVMVLNGTAEQEADLAQFLRNVQTPGQPEFHRWLTPQAFGERFGAAPEDLAAIRAWLQLKGFRLEKATAGRRSIVFSGTVGQLNDAFAARMHLYRWNGERHLANSSNPTIPQALAGIVTGFASLHDFRLAPQWQRASSPAVTPQGAQPAVTMGNGSHFLGPGDFATLYNLTSSYASGLTGSDRTIAVIGRSDINAVDISNFRSAFGLAPAQPAIILAGSDPGFSTNDQTESDLDLEWAGALAPAAALKFVIAANTNTTDGIVLSSLLAVEQNVADIITVSYAGCESADNVSGGTTFFHQLWQQAAAQGTSVFVSSGDAGAAGCDGAGSTTATHGLGVNLVCSSPYSTCVGGTEFNADVSSPGTYWNATNAPVTNASALQYIGEVVWNDSGSVPGGSSLLATGGGASLYYAKPSWQLTTGVPSDAVRDVPDVSIHSSPRHDPYLIYSSDGRSSSTLESIGGTSAAAPSMAGIAALLVQHQGGRVGNFNPVLYGLAARQASGGAPVFHLITSGNNSVPGQAGFAASAASPHYNQATGLGSVDAGALIAHWSDFVGSNTGLSPANAVVPSSATVGSAQLNLPSTTAWTASVAGGAPWLTVSPTSGVGSAPITYAATANNSSVSRSGTIAIDGQALTVVQAAGSGSSPQLRLSASSLSFGADAIGFPTAGQTLLVSNTGSANLTLGALGLTGAATDYQIQGSCSAGLVLTAGASCYVQVIFDPTSTGSRAAILHIGSSSVALAGEGQTAPDSDGPMPVWAYALMGILILGLVRARGLPV